MLFIAHRGESLEAPENTMAAFRLAWNRHCRCIECDVHMTSDGEIVCIHDASTARTTGVDLLVAKTPYAKLWSLDAGAWKGEDWEGEAIPKLSDVLSEMPADARVYIEIKSHIDILDRLKRVIKQAPVSMWQIRIIAFDDATAARAREIFPGVKVHLLVSFKETPDGLVPDAKTLVAHLKELGVDGVGTHAHDDLTEEYVNTVRNADIDYNVWTVDDVDQVKRFIAMGVDSITSNHAAYLSGKFYT
jgi:glycerophosphoryl diester phosphodiesterase